ncbi:MAG: hypothetical protein M1817_002584 [Caeruleum heppii]|nr:MAG: hypothetical protein M1817_002584 [Caeruleum heppii]
MAFASGTNTDAPALTAVYTSPASSESFAHPLPSLPPSTTISVDQKTAYLSALRSSVTKLQDEVNVFLTTKMEEEKAAAATASGEAASGRLIDDTKEEEQYGEEVVDEKGQV